MNDDDPKTVAEQLDEAQSGEEWVQVLYGLFNRLEPGREV